MRKPLFLEDIDYLGVWYWVEIEAFDMIVRKQSGNFAFIENEIMGWDCKSLDKLWKKQREVNYAPRYRFWEGDQPPTEEERSAGEWHDDCRVWMPAANVLFDPIDGKAKAEEWKQSGRTVWR